MSASGESSILFVLAGYDRGFLLLIQEAFCSRLALVGVGARVGRASGQASLRTVLDGQFRLNDHAGSLDGGLEDSPGTGRKSGPAPVQTADGRSECPVPEHLRDVRMTVIVDLVIASASSTCRPRLRLDRRPGAINGENLAAGQISRPAGPSRVGACAFIQSPTSVRV